MAGQIEEIDPDQIGEDLEKEYGTKDPDTPIDYFYIRLGQEIVEKITKENESTFTAALDVLDTGKSFKKVTWGWGLLIFEHPRESEHLSNRDQEKQFNEKRKALITKLKKLSFTSPSEVHVMFSRACLYTNFIVEEKMDTDRIRKVLSSAYTAQDMQHIDYFYLFVHAKQGEQPYTVAQIKQESADKPCTQYNICDMALLILKNLPGEWRQVEPRKTWPGTFFGYFPRQMSERERESRLNEDVRIPLIGKLRHQLAHTTRESKYQSKPTVHVIISRACKYTDLYTP